MKALILSLLIATIISQSVHTWYVFDSFSIIKNRALKVFQGVLFCGILSLSILAFVLAGRTDLAIAGAIIEAIINISYYTEDFWRTGFGQKSRGGVRKSIVRFWRIKWRSLLFALVMPALIYVFAEMI